MIGLLYEDPPTEGESVWDDEVGQLPPLKASGDLRSQLHVICALYAYAPTLDRRLALLDHLENLARQAIHLKARELLESGWRPADNPFGLSADAA